MRASQLLITTTREIPGNAETISHQLMLRAGLIRQLASGLYTWLPLGFRALKKVEGIVREAMDQIGAQEILMPMVQPAELWQKSQRWQAYGAELLRIQDRHQRDFCLGPTHEEVITDLMRQQVKSYKQLPMMLYQIQTKFRDEIRPRFGVMRAREFIMKDAYSFHADQASLCQTYQRVRCAYQQILQRMELDFKIVGADSGSIGGSISEEFHVLADAGEDMIGYSHSGNYAANIETIALQPPQPLPLLQEKTQAKLQEKSAEPQSSSHDTYDHMQMVATPQASSVQDVAQQLHVSRKMLVKTLVVHAADTTPEKPSLIALLLRGDHQLNQVKAAKHPAIKSPLTMAGAEEMQQVIGMKPGFIGPVDLGLPLLADYSVAACRNFVCGANQDGYHLVGVNWKRDLPEPEWTDLRNAVKGDPSPDGSGTLSICRGIEVGHIFQLGTKYSAAMQAHMMNPEGIQQNMRMGCYGIGVSRIVAATIEQKHDAQGIVWPLAIAPFRVVIIALDTQETAVCDTAERLYQHICQQFNNKYGSDQDVLLDDRDLRPGNKFMDMDLLGIPYQIIVGRKALARQQFECKTRYNQQKQLLREEEIAAWLQIV